MAQDTLNSNPSIYWGVTTNTPSVGRAAIFKWSESREQAFQGPPRPSWHFCNPPIIDTWKFAKGTPKCYSWWICTHKPVNSKSNGLVCACEHCAKREPSLTIGMADISWVVLLMLALEEAKAGMPKAVPKCRMCTQRPCFSRNRYDVLANLLERFLDLFEKRDHKKQLTKIKFFMYCSFHIHGIMYCCLCMQLETCLKWTVLIEKAEGTIPPHLFSACGWEILANS
jgi:hypothetical protein